jgi:hypothetical protein
MSFKWFKAQRTSDFFRHIGREVSPSSLIAFVVMSIIIIPFFVLKPSALLDIPVKGKFLEAPI